MNVFLMHKDHDLDVSGALPQGAEAVTPDLEPGSVLAAMAARDEFLLGIACRTFRVPPRVALPTSYGQDVYRKTSPLRPSPCWPRRMDSRDG